MKLRKLIFWFSLFLLVAFAGAGCQRRPLELMINNTIRVIVRCVWEVKAYPEGEKPTGITLYFFKDGEFFKSITTASVDSVEVQLDKGHYNMYLIGQTEGEYSSMVFDSMMDYEDASTSLKERPADWASRGQGELIVRDPEVLVAGVAKEFDITQEMVEEYQTYYADWYEQQQRLAANSETKASVLDERNLAFLEEKIQYLTVRIPVYPKNVVSQFQISIYAGNIDVLKSMRASTSGMARTFEITQDVTDKPGATQVITAWRVNVDDLEHRIGHVEGIINTFGLPDGQHPSSLRDSTLNVSALLVDGKTVTDYTFNVGDKIRELPPNPGYRQLLSLVLGSSAEPMITFPDVEQEDSGGGGFTANVADWGEEMEVDIPI
jgi:hypothetical protein